MADELESLRYELIREKAASSVASARSDRLFAQLGQLHVEHESAARERDRLRIIVESQARELNDLRERVKDRESQKSLDLAKLVDASAAAVFHGAAALDGYAVQSASLQLRLGMGIDQSSLVFRSPSSLPPEAISAVTLNLASAPPSLTSALAGTAFERLRIAVTAVQRALDTLSSQPAANALGVATRWLSAAGPADALALLPALYKALLPLLPAAAAALRADVQARAAAAPSALLDTAALDVHTGLLQAIAQTIAPG